MKPIYSIVNHILTINDSKQDRKVFIYKVQKKGTKRVFYRVEDINQNNVTRILFVRLYDAKNCANKYLES